MQAEDRVIHFSVELIHPPAPVKRQALQKLYFDLSQTRAVYDNIDMADLMQARFYSRRGKAQSLLVFLPDRVLMVEEWSDIPLSDFEEKIRIAVPVVMKNRGANQVIIHSATIRSTFALTHYDDARVFLLDNACSLQGRIAPHFNRPIATGGLKLVFPETNEHPGNLHVNIESFRHSANEMFVEVKAIFGRQPVTTPDVEPIIANLRQTRAFITDRVFPFLQQFDCPQEAF
ncbi:MAG TPA: hypothetical protein ENN29_05720 [Candidatus Hydrogenedentes bacterium]|nr:hypothetical protein [Candidatus Hydrogenedentota bacterium]